jgi:hypothetical protein
MLILLSGYGQKMATLFSARIALIFSTENQASRRFDFGWSNEQTVTVY